MSDKEVPPIINPDDPLARALGVQGEQAESSRPSHWPHWLGEKFSWPNLIVFAISEFVGGTLCIAAAEAFVHRDWIAVGLGWGPGLPLAIFGLAFPFRGHLMRAQTQERIQRQAIRWAPVVIAAAFVYVVGPTIYKRAISTPLNVASVDVEVQKSTLIGWLQQAQQERDHAIDARNAAQTALTGFEAQRATLAQGVQQAQQERDKAIAERIATQSALNGIKSDKEQLQQKYDIAAQQLDAIKAQNKVNKLDRYLSPTQKNELSELVESVVKTLDAHYNRMAAAIPAQPFPFGAQWTQNSTPRETCVKAMASLDDARNYIDTDLREIQKLRSDSFFAKELERIPFQIIIDLGAQIRNEIQTSQMFMREVRPKLEQYADIDVQRSLFSRSTEELNKLAALLLKLQSATASVKIQANNIRQELSQ